MILRSDPAWFTARVGFLTASRMSDVLDVLKNGKPGARRTKLLHSIVAARMTGIAGDNYVNDAMQWGIDHQDEAISEYEIETGNIVAPEAFVIHPTIENLGATPDGFIGDDGLLEVKCPTSTTHLQWIMDGVIPEQHKPQMAVQLLCTGRKWVDFMSYDPRMPPKQKKFLRRFENYTYHVTNVPGLFGYLDDIREEAVKFLAEVDALFEEVTTS